MSVSVTFHAPLSFPDPDTKPSPRLGELTVTGVTLDSVGLSWTVPEGEFDSFVVQYKDRDGQPQVVPVAADQREVTVSDLEPSKKYKFLLYGLAGRKRLGPISAEGSTGELCPPVSPPHSCPHCFLAFSWTAFHLIPQSWPRGIPAKFILRSLALS